MIIKPSEIRKKIWKRINISIFNRFIFFTNGFLKIIFKLLFMTCFIIFLSLDYYGLNMYLNKYFIYLLYFVGYGYTFDQLYKLKSFLFSDEDFLYELKIINISEYCRFLKKGILKLLNSSTSDSFYFINCNIINFECLSNDIEIMTKAIQRSFIFLPNIGIYLTEAENNELSNNINNYLNSIKSDKKTLATHLYQTDITEIRKIEARMPDIAQYILDTKGNMLYSFFLNFNVYLKLDNVNDKITQKNSKELVYSQDKCYKWFIPSNSRKQSINFGTFFKIDSENLLYIFMGENYLHLGIIKHHNYLIKEASKKEAIQGLEFKNFKSIPLKCYAKAFILSDEVKIFYDFENSNFNKELKQLLNKFDNAL